jgi:hypothetical protein
MLHAAILTNARHSDKETQHKSVALRIHCVLTSALEFVATKYGYA